jgi:hypothetical protein
VYGGETIRLAFRPAAVKPPASLLLTGNGG